jgi:hypothetical protein
MKHYALGAAFAAYLLCVIAAGYRQDGLFAIAAALFLYVGLSAERKR